MAFTTVDTPAVGDAILLSLLIAMIANDEDLNDRLGLVEGSGILNGSFEHDVDGDGIADGWTADESGGGEVSLSTAQRWMATQSCQIVLGAAGEYAFVQSGESDLVGDMVPTGYGERIVARFAYKVEPQDSSADVPVTAWLRFFDGTGTQVGADSEIYTIADGSMDWRQATGQAVCPDGALFYRLKLQAGGAAGGAGTVWFDACSTGPYHGPVYIASHNDASPGTGTETHTLDAAVYTAGERPRVAYLGVTLGGVLSCALQGWIGGAWENIAAASFAVPLNEDLQYRTVASGPGATVYCFGYEV